MATCNECNGACCREICVEIDEPKTVEDWDEIRWMVAHENIAVYVDDEDDWLVEIQTNCSKLNKDNKCLIYEKRPLICKDHKTDTCVKNAEEEGEKLRFNNVEEVEAHIEKVVKPKIRKDLDEWKL
ncbi:YkgJ family cysteine cluster protein [Candidatus Woesearchaeota archaeon]|nr:YkgJ family cysteine cluster protein [Candidatus Woesearchaeota archaeon]